MPLTCSGAMKKLPSKKDIRDDLEHQIAQFLQQGGQIYQAQTGQSGLSTNLPWINPFQPNDKPREQTSVAGVIAAIDARKKKRPAPSRQAKKARKVPVLDDFGEPVRWVWADK